MDALFKLYYLPLDAKDELLKKCYKLCDSIMTAGIVSYILLFYYNLNFR